MNILEFIFFFSYVIKINMGFECYKSGNTCRTIAYVNYNDLNNQLYINSLSEATGKSIMLNNIQICRPLINKHGEWLRGGLGVYNYQIYENIGINADTNLSENQPSGTCNFNIQWTQNGYDYNVTGYHNVKIDANRGSETVADFYKEQLKNVIPTQIIIENLYIDRNKMDLQRHWKVTYRRHTNFIFKLKIKNQ